MSENSGSGGGKREEVVVLAGVRARMAAYQQEIQRKDKIRKNAKQKPVFKVADDLGVSFHSSDGMPLKDKMPVTEENEMSLSQVEHNNDEDHVFQRSMNASARTDFFGDAGIQEEELEVEPEKPQEVKDEEEK